MRDNTQNQLNPPIIRSSFQDFDRNGTPERWNITMRIRKPNAKSVLNSVLLLIDFDYSTKDVVKMEMESLAIINIDIPSGTSNPAKSIKTIGTLELK